jgi:succinylarginine dihydrolase
VNDSFKPSETPHTVNHDFSLGFRLKSTDLNESQENGGGLTCLRIKNRIRKPFQVVIIAKKTGRRLPSQKKKWISTTSIV